jgi:protein TonB
MKATIAEDGSVQDLKVINGDPILAQAASDAVKQWRYEPYLLNGKPIRKQMEITLEFKPTE